MEQGGGPPGASNLADKCKKDREAAALWYRNSSPAEGETPRTGTEGLGMTKETHRWQVAALSHVS